MAQLGCSDLKPGDILLKLPDGGILTRAIQLGQNITGHVNPRIVHAGVMFDSTFIIEAQSSGISANDLRVQNKAYAYIVYRSTQPMMAQGAGTCAKMMFDIHKQHGGLKYSIGGAFGSLFGRSGSPTTAGEMDGLLDRILQGKNQSFFCSHFVVYVWQFVARQTGMAASGLFPANAASMNPSDLASQLVHNAHFREAGWMFANER